MAIVYQLQCSGCDFKKHVGADHALALRLDDRIEIVPHPSEQVTLKKLGYTFSTAIAEHRLLNGRAVMCVNCFEKDFAYNTLEDSPSCGGVFIGFLAAIILTTASVYFLPWPWAVVAPGVLIAGGIIFLWLYGRSAKVRAALHDGNLPNPKLCKACGGDLHQFHSMNQVDCTKCGGKKTITLNAYGKS